MNPYTGEVLALVSTPSYDNNDFIMGLSSEQWTALNDDENKPMYNRFWQVWCPGSTFKPVTAAVGLKSGAIDPNEDYGNVGLSWQSRSIPIQKVLKQKYSWQTAVTVRDRF